MVRVLRLVGGAAGRRAARQPGTRLWLRRGHLELGPETGRAIPNGPGVVPSPGDLIIFGDHHVGIVDKVLPNGSIQTIEGNYSDQVSRVVRGAGEATGYVRLG